MNDAQRDLLTQAQASLEAARLLDNQGYCGFSVSRAYYSMFYAAEAFLLTKGLTYSKHAGVIAAFGRECVKSGQVPAEYHRWLIQALELRQVGDYGRVHEISGAQSRELLSRAQAFLKLAQSKLE